MDRSLNCFLRIYSVSVLAQRVATPSLPKNSGKSRCRGCPTTCKTLPSDFGYINAKDLHEHSVSNPYPKYKPTHKKKGSRKNIRALLCVPQATVGGCQPAKPPHTAAILAPSGGCGGLAPPSFGDFPSSICLSGACVAPCPAGRPPHRPQAGFPPRPRRVRRWRGYIKQILPARPPFCLRHPLFLGGRRLFFCQRHPFQENDLCRSAPTSRKS